jgi:hypothetical protein
LIAGSVILSLILSVNEECINGTRTIKKPHISGFFNDYLRALKQLFGAAHTCRNVRQCSESLFGDLFATFCAYAIVAIFDTDEGSIDELYGVLGFVIDR